MSVLTDSSPFVTHFTFPLSFLSLFQLGKVAFLKAISRTRSVFFPVFAIKTGSSYSMALN
jgi:hypothetical protein